MRVLETSGDWEKDCFASLAKSRLRKEQKGGGVSFSKKAKPKNGLFNVYLLAIVNHKKPYNDEI